MNNWRYKGSRISVDSIYDKKACKTSVGKLSNSIINRLYKVFLSWLHSTTKASQYSFANL